MKNSSIRHSEALLIAWRLAELEATNLRCAELEPEHYFLALLKLVELDVAAILAENTTLSDQRIQQEVCSVLKLATCLATAGLETTQIRRRLRRGLPRGSKSDKEDTHLRRSGLSREVFAEADQVAAQTTCGMIEPLHLLAGIVTVSGPWLVSVLDQAGIAAGDFSEAVLTALQGTAIEQTGPVEARPSQEQHEPDKQVNKRKPANSLVDRLGRDLTALAQQGQLSPVIGRKQEMRSLIQTLLRSRKNNAILIGEAGVGKTGVVEGLAQRIAKGEVPPEFASKRIIEISMGSLVAGTNLRGDMEARLQILIAEAKRDPDLILFIDEIHLMAGAGQGSGAMDAANLLKPALARGEVCIIGATTTQEYRKHIEVDPALARRFEVIEVLEPDRTETIAILQGLRSNIEAHHGVKIEDGAIDAAVDLTIRYLPTHRLPDKAIDVLDQACAQARLRSLSGDFRAQFMAGLSITRKDVASAVAHRCKVPVGELNQDDYTRLLRLEADLEKRVKGQRRAVEAVSEAIRLARSGLKQGGKPIGVFLFAGPSGTGKTELAKALAECLFGNEKQLIRIDMSELMEAHSVSKLIGAPPGFIGHDQGGQLTEQIRSHPYSVVLLDEVEKAHPKILDIFLQIFDNGFITDSHGIRCDFRETIIILTSNVGAVSKKAAIGFQKDEKEVSADTILGQTIFAAARNHFRPEFINRLTEIVAFQPLGHDEIRQVLALIIDRLNERLKEKNIALKLSPEAEAILIAQGFSEEFGARHLERTVERLISKPLAQLILSNEAEPGSLILCSEIDGHLCLRHEALDLNFNIIKQ
jgi:ATP-dependent Clp protease ATP-binding subunit ClpC